MSLEVFKLNPACILEELNCLYVQSNICQSETEVFMQYETMLIFHFDDYDMNHYPRDIGLKQNAFNLVDTQFVRSHEQKT